MEILIEGKSKAYSKLPSWLELTVKELCLKKPSYVLILYRLKDKPSGSYDIYNHRSKTILRIIKNKANIQIESMRQKIPVHNSPHTPTWDIVNSKTLQFETGSFKTICEAILEMVMSDICIVTPYFCRTHSGFTKSKVGAYPTEEDPLYGGRIVSSQLQYDFYQITLDNNNQHYLPKHLGDKVQFSPGSYLVIRDNLFNVVNPGVFFDYFCLY